MSPLRCLSVMLFIFFLPHSIFQVLDNHVSCGIWKLSQHIFLPLEPWPFPVVLGKMQGVEPFGQSPMSTPTGAGKQVWEDQLPALRMPLTPFLRLETFSGSLSLYSFSFLGNCVLPAFNYVGSFKQPEPWRGYLWLVRPRQNLQGGNLQKFVCREVCYNPK